MSTYNQLFDRINAPQIVPGGTAHTQVTITSTASTLTTLGYTAVTGAGGYLIQVNGANVRYTLDGTTPTTTKGFLIVDGQSALLTPSDHATAKWIKVSGTPVMEIQCVR